MQSATALWQGLPVEVRSSAGSDEAGPRYNPFPLISYCVRGAGRTVFSSGRRTSDILVLPGVSVIFEQSYEMDHSSWSGVVDEVVTVEIRPETMRVLMPEDDGTLGLNTFLPVEDPTLAMLSIAIRDELQRGCTSGRLFAQGLSVAFVSYLQSRYGATPVPRRAAGRLSQIELRKVTDYVMQYLDGDTGIAEIAAQLNMSAAHFSRSFRATTGISPYRYVQEQRVRQALALLQGAQSLAEIAQAVGFANQSHFTQVFRQLLGTTPARARHDSDFRLPARLRAS
jgi:AraC-type DNA-binding domain-containing proteins